MLPPFPLSLSLPVLRKHAATVEGRRRPGSHQQPHRSQLETEKEEAGM